MPDMFENLTDSTVTHKTSITTSYTYNGVEYESLDDMPPEVRKLFESIDDLDLDPPAVTREVADDEFIVTTPPPKRRAHRGPTDEEIRARNVNIFMLLLLGIVAFAVIMMVIYRA